MKVNNNMNSPQFGMLKLEKGSEKYLSKLGEKGKALVSMATEELKNSKYFDTIIDISGPRIQSKSGDLWLRSFSTESRPIGGDLWIRCLDDAKIAVSGITGPKASRFGIFYDSQTEAKNVYDRMHSFIREGNEIGMNTFITKELDKYYEKGFEIVV